MHPDTIVLGSALTMDPSRPRAGGIGISGERIVAVGGRDEILATRTASTEVVDGGRGTVLPGFYDAHQHQLYVGLWGRQVDAAVDSLGDLLGRIRRAASTLPAPRWIEGFGWDENRLIERRPPAAADLDAAAPGRSVLLTRTCGHVAVASSQALLAAGIDRTTPDPPGGRVERDAAGRPTGLLHERAGDLVRRIIPQPTAAELDGAILSAAADNLRLGITSVWEASVEPVHIEAYRRLEEQARLPLRVTMAQARVLRSTGETTPIASPYRSSWLSLVAVKLLQDGALAPRTAALSAPYEGEPGNRGLTIWPQEELDAAVREIAEAGLGVSIHAIGDVAIASAVRALSALPRPWPKGVRHRIEHCGLPLGSSIADLRRTGIVPVLQPIFIRFHGETYARNVGRARSRWLYPTRTLLDHCPIVAGSSDAPVVPDRNPLLGIQAAMTRATASGEVIGPEERISLHRALALYTSGAAAAASEEGDKGSVSVGKLADIVVYDEDLERLPVDELAPREPVETIVGGRRSRVR